MNQAGMLAPVLDDLFDARFFAETLLLDVFDLDPVFSGNLFGVVADGIPQRLGKQR